MRPSTTSKFISPFVDTVDPQGAGSFVYTTTFTLEQSVDLESFGLVVSYASDNAVTAIALNGQSQANVSGGSYSSFQNVVINEGFVSGENSVTVTVSNDSGPTGLRVEFHDPSEF